MAHTYNGILLSHKKEQNNAICSNMDGPGDHTYIHLSEVSQTEDKYCVISLICGIEKKWYKWPYLQNRNRLTDVENELMVTGGKGGGGRDRLGVWDWHAHCCI